MMRSSARQPMKVLNISRPMKSETLEQASGPRRETSAGVTALWLCVLYLLRALGAYALARR